MWIIQEPKKLALWNKLHFEERKKNGEYRACLKYSVPTFVGEIYKMQRLEVSGAVRLIYRSLGVKGLMATAIKMAGKCQWVIFEGPISVAWVCGCSLAGIAGSVPDGGVDVCCVCCVLSGTGVCEGPIAVPEEFHRVWCVWVPSWSLDYDETLTH